MDRKKARKAAEVMLAYAEGKEIEFKRKEELWDSWQKTSNPNFNFEIVEYRIKPEPKCRPFKDAEECWQEMKKHQPFGWVKTKDEVYPVITTIGTLYKDETEPTDRGTFSYSESFNSFTFADGTPFGVLEESV